MQNNRARVSPETVRVLNSAQMFPCESDPNKAVYKIRYYIGFLYRDGTACRLSNYFRYEWQAEAAIRKKDYSQVVEVKELSNGGKLYFAVQEV